MLEALKALKVRIAFIGMPQEPFRNDRMGKIPDWRKELALLEAALDKAGGNLSLEEFKTAIKKMKGK